MRRDIYPMTEKMLRHKNIAPKSWREWELGRRL